MKMRRSGRPALAAFAISTVACGSLLGGVELDDEKGRADPGSGAAAEAGAGVPAWTPALQPTPATSSDDPLASAGESVRAPDAPPASDGNGCDDGAFRCTEALLEYCDAGSWLPWQECASAATCESEPAGRCLPPVCNPGTRRCSGAALELCTEDASGWEQVELCATAAHCDASLEACREVPCLPEERRCNEGTLESCRADLLGWDVLEDCGSAALCEHRPGEQSAECLAPACSEGEFRCSDDGTLRACGLDRAGFVSFALCGSAELCNASEGRCESPVAVAEPRADDVPTLPPSRPVQATPPAQPSQPSQPSQPGSASDDERPSAPPLDSETPRDGDDGNDNGGNDNGGNDGSDDSDRGDGNGSDGSDGSDNADRGNDGNGNGNGNGNDGNGNDGNGSDNADRGNDGSDNADRGNDNADRGNDNADRGNDNADRGSDNADRGNGDRSSDDRDRGSDGDRRGGRG